MDQSFLFLMLSERLRRHFPEDVLFSLRSGEQGVFLCVNGLGDGHPLLISLDAYTSRVSGPASAEDALREVEYRCAEKLLRCRPLALPAPSSGFARARLVLRVLPVRENESCLQRHPHMHFGAFALFYGIRLSSPFPYVRFIDRLMLKDWNLSEETLHRDALRFCHEAEPPLVLPSRQMLQLLAEKLPEKGLPKDFPRKRPFYVLTNRFLEGGASVLFYPGFLSQLYERFGPYSFLITSPDEALLFPGSEENTAAWDFFSDSRFLRLIRRDMPETFFCRYDRFPLEKLTDLQLQLDKAQRFR